MLSVFKTVGSKSRASGRVASGACQARIATSLSLHRGHLPSDLPCARHALAMLPSCPPQYQRVHAGMMPLRFSHLDAPTCEGQEVWRLEHVRLGSPFLCLCIGVILSRHDRVLSMRYQCCVLVLCPHRRCVLAGMMPLHISHLAAQARFIVR